MYEPAMARKETYNLDLEWKSKTRVTSSDIPVTNSNKKTWVKTWVKTRLKTRVPRLKRRFGRLKARVRKLQVRAEAIKPRV